MDEKTVTNVITMQNICKSYTMGNDTLNVLKNVGFTVQKGEFVAILGPSGSGKSTLMNIIGCMDRFDTGEYFLSGIPIHSTKEKELVRIRNQEIGFIFQTFPSLLSYYTVVISLSQPHFGQKSPSSMGGTLYLLSHHQSVFQVYA